jgi:hypothetical protein
MIDTTALYTTIYVWVQMVSPRIKNLDRCEKLVAAATMSDQQNKIRPHSEN